jgi:hypothetical protein
MLTWWEYEELREHFRSRTDIWMQSEDNPLLWLRSQEDDSCCAFQFTAPADTTSDFRLYRLTVHSMFWDDAKCKLYAERMLLHWTSYAQRERVETFLRTEVGVAPELAALAAIAIASFDYSPRPKDPEKEFEEPQQEILPDTFRIPNYTPLHDYNHIGTWILRDGGYVALRLEGEMIRAQISIKAKNYDGYDPFGLSGYVRHRSLTSEQFAACLAGWPLAEDEAREAANKARQEACDRAALVSLLADEGSVGGDEERVERRDAGGSGASSES